MVRYNYEPGKGHLGDMLRIFGYLKNHMKHQIICDTRFLKYQVEVDLEYNWSGLYPDDVGEIPPDMPDPKGVHVMIT